MCVGVVGRNRKVRIKPNPVQEICALSDTTDESSCSSMTPLTLEKLKGYYYFFAVGLGYQAVVRDVVASLLLFLNLVESKVYNQQLYQFCQQGLEGKCSRFLRLREYPNCSIK